MVKTKVRIGFAGTPKIAFDHFSKLLEIDNISIPDVTEIKTDIATIKADIETLTKDISRLESGNPLAG